MTTSGEASTRKRDFISFRNGLLTVAATLTAAAILWIFNYLPTDAHSRAFFCVFFFLLGIAILLTPWVNICLRSASLLFFLFSLLMAFQAYKIWLKDNANIIVTLKSNKLTGAGLTYYFIVENSGKGEIEVLNTSQDNESNNFSNLASVKRRNIGPGEKIKVAGNWASGLKADDRIILTIVYRLNGPIRTYEARFQTPNVGDDATPPVGVSDDLSPDALSAQSEAERAFRTLSFPEGGFMSGLREKKEGKWNFTSLEGKNKRVIYDPENHVAQIEAIQRDGSLHGFFVRFPPAERHYLYVEWRDSDDTLAMGVDGRGSITINGLPPRRILTPGEKQAPVF